MFSLWYWSSKYKGSYCCSYTTLLIPSWSMVAGLWFSILPIAFRVAPGGYGPYPCFCPCLLLCLPSLVPLVLSSLLVLSSSSSVCFPACPAGSLLPCLPAKLGLDRLLCRMCLLHRILGWHHLLSLQLADFKTRDYICVDYSFCCIFKELVDSLEQTICWYKISFHPTTV